MSSDMVQFSANDDPPHGRDGGFRAKLPVGSIRYDSFTVASANQMLPLLTRIVSDLIALSVDLEQQNEQIRGIESLPTPNKIAAFSDELNAIKESFSTDRQRLVSCHRELSSLGVKIDSLTQGAIDFPAFLNRRPVMLCWKLGEAAVTHWHHLNESFEQRREIAGHCFDPVPPSVV
jgi:hypothetical protein